jgi:hypothetical protein
LLGIGDSDGAAVVVADADRGQFHLAQALAVVDHLAQVLFEIIAGVDRECRIVDRRAVGDHHQDAALLGAGAQAFVRPDQRLAVDVLLEDALAQHQPEATPRAPPRVLASLSPALYCRRGR